MTNCSYCGKELNRHVFCNPSHKVMYYRKGNKSKKPVIQKVTKTVREVKPVIEKITEDKGFKLCKHGMAIGLCKFGCEK